MAGYRNRQARARAAFIAKGGATPTPTPGPGYDVFVLAGQSNMVGRYGPVDATLDATDSRILMYGFDAQTVSLAADPLDHQDETANTVGMGVSFAKAYIAAGLLGSARQVLLVPVAKGSTSFVSGFWRAGGGGDAPAIARTNAAMSLPGNNILKGILWHQGEGDQGQTEAAYAADLDALVARWRASMTGASASTPFLCGGLLAGGAQSGAEVGYALAALPNRVPYTAYVSSASLTSGGDNIHFDAASQRAFGGRYNAAIATAKANASPSAAAPGAPVAFNVTPSNGSASLAWNAAPSNGSAITNYIREYKLASDTTWTTITGTSTALNATITGLTNGQTYNFRVRAVNSIGEGANATANATPAANLVGTNLLAGPNTLDTYTLVAATVTTDVAANPVSGATDVDRLTDTTANDGHTATSPTTGSQPLTANTQYTIACDFKVDGASPLTFAQIYLPSGIWGTGAYANFDLTAGSASLVGSTTAATITSLGNGWWRCAITCTTTAAATAAQNLAVFRGIPNGARPRAATYTGTGTGILMANRQMVTGSVANAF